MIDIEKIFLEKFNKKADMTSFSPGRVNLIGEHTDYNNGYVMPLTVQYGTWVAISKREDSEFHFYSENFHELKQRSLEERKEAHWSDYLLGVLKELNWNKLGMNVAVWGNIPQGAGLSSSASIELAFIKALSLCYEIDLDGKRAAKIGQAAENNYVGCQCGIMDQFISSLGEEKKVMLLDCESLAFENVNIPNELSVIVINSKVKRGLVDSEYNQRREQCEKACQSLGVSSLRDIEKLEELNSLSGLPLMRARHVVSENDRVLSMKRALQNKDFKQIYKLMYQSHHSMQEDFEITTSELDFLVELVKQSFSEVAGIRMTGGGFGGCLVILCENEYKDKICHLIENNYEKQTGLKEEIYFVESKKGAFC